MKFVWRNLWLAPYREAIFWQAITLKSCLVSTNIGQRHGEYLEIKILFWSPWYCHLQTPFIQLNIQCPQIHLLLYSRRFDLRDCSVARYCGAWNCRQWKEDTISCLFPAALWRLVVSTDRIYWDHTQRRFLVEPTKDFS